MKLRGVAMLGTALALAACITPATYGAIGKSPYGYQETHNPDGGYTLRTAAPSADLAHEFWDRRAAELCGGPDFRKNIYSATRPIVRVSGYVAGTPGTITPGGGYSEDQYGNFLLEGYLHCGAQAAAPAAVAPEPAAQQPDAVH